MSRREARAARVAGKRRAGGLPWHRRHRKLVVGVVGVLVLALAVVTGCAYYLNSRLNNIDKVATTAIEKNTDPDEGRALNILMLGSDKGEAKAGQSKKTTVAEDAKAATWPSGKYRSDTLMIVHISASRKKVYLTSIPRDTFTMLYNAKGEAEHKEKINAAFSYYGPDGAINTVEHLTGLQIDHLAIIDWAGFKDLSTAVGGVKVYIPSAFYDPYQKIQWEAGTQVLKGKKALAYVRTRHGLLRGDFDRIARQQNFLRSLMKKMLSSGVTSNPVRLTKTLTAVTSHLTVDSGWTSSDLRGLALSLRHMSSKDVAFITAPVGDTTTDPTYGSIVELDEAKSAELWTALKRDKVRAFVEKYPDDVLANDKSVR